MDLFDRIIHCLLRSLFARHVKNLPQIHFHGDADAAAQSQLSLILVVSRYNLLPCAFSLLLK